MSLPGAWTSAPLESVADSALGKMLDRAKRIRGSSLPYLRNINVRWGSFNLGDLLEMPFEDHELERYGLLPGDVLVCEGGEPGRAAVWRGAQLPIKFQKAIHRVRPTVALEPQWLVHQLRHDALNGDLEEHFSGTTIKHFTGVALARYPVRLPPVPEQRRIVTKLEALTTQSRRAKEALDAVPPLLERFRQSVLASAFRGDLTAAWRAKNPDVEPAEKLLARIRIERRRRWEEAELARMAAKGKSPGDDKWKQKYDEPEPIDMDGLPELPLSWTHARVDTLVVPGTVITYGIVLPGPEMPGGVPYVRQQDVGDGFVRVDDLRHTTAEIASKHDRASLIEGDVLLCIIRNLRVAIVPKGLDGANITQGMVRIRPSELILGRYLAAYLSSAHAQEWMKLRYFGMDMPRINVEDARAVPVAVPPIDEQVQVVRLIEQKLGALSKVMNEFESSRGLLEGLDRSILAKAFRGDLVPQDPSDEPASVLLERIRAERASASSGKDKKKPTKRT